MNLFPLSDCDSTPGVRNPIWAQSEWTFTVLTWLIPSLKATAHSSHDCWLWEAGESKKFPQGHASFLYSSQSNSMSHTCTGFLNLLIMLTASSFFPSHVYVRVFWVWLFGFACLFAGLFGFWLVGFCCLSWFLVFLFVCLGGLFCVIFFS